MTLNNSVRFPSPRCCLREAKRPVLFHNRCRRRSCYNEVGYNIGPSLGFWFQMPSSGFTSEAFIMIGFGRKAGSGLKSVFSLSLIYCLARLMSSIYPIAFEYMLKSAASSRFNRENLKCLVSHRPKCRLYISYSVMVFTQIK